MPGINGMGDGAKLDVSSFRVAEFSDVLDWRPMLFQEPVIAQRACVLCGVVYKKAVRLPCIHTLCAKCHAECVERGSACPVDQKPFCEDDVEQLEVSPKYLLNRTVGCRNLSATVVDLNVSYFNLLTLNTTGILCSDGSARNESLLHLAPKRLSIAPHLHQ
uniref:Putative tnf receptor-associated factor n=1 Tax=Ixodes ricinus TaxID=34613 RepID=A0A6B0UX84_IXORI